MGDTGAYRLRHILSVVFQGTVLSPAAVRREADMAPEPKKGTANARMDAGKAAQLVEAIKKEQRYRAELLWLAIKLRHL